MGMVPWDRPNSWPGGNVGRRLWTTPTSFVEISQDRAILASEIATRDRSPDFTSLLMVLPDPDPVLKKQGQSIKVYKDLLVDAHVDAVVQSRLSGVLRREYRVEPGGTSAQDKKAAELCELFLAELDVDRINDDALSAVMFGYAPLEVIWGDLDGYWVPADIVGKPQEWFIFDTEGQLRFKSKEHWDGELLPDYKFVLVQNRATYVNPYGERVLSRVFWPVTFKRGGLKFWAVFTERYGMPFAVGKVPPSATARDKADLLDRLTNMVQDAVAVIPDNSSVELLADSGRASSADIYQKLIDSCNAEISKAVLGQTLTTEIGQTGGAYAASETHFGIRADILDRDSKMVANAWKTVFRWVVELNIPGAAVPEFMFHEEEDLQEDLANRDKVLTDQGLKFTPEYYKKKYGLEDEDFEVKKQQDPPPFGFQGLPPQPGQPGQPGTEDPGQGDPNQDAQGDPNQDTKAKEFSEVPKTYVPLDRREGVTKLQDLVANAAQKAAPALQSMVETVIQEAEDCTSFQELLDKVTALYPRLEVTQLVNLLAQAGFNSEVYGRLTGRRMK